MLWQFTIIERNGTRVIIDEPVGWDSMDKTISRDDTWHGIFFKFSEGNIEFTDIAYFIIKEEYINYGIDGDIGLQIEWKCEDYAPYKEFFTGKLDFQRYNEICDTDCSIKIGIENSTPELLIKNRQDTSVDLLKTTAYDNTTALANYIGLGLNIDVPGKKIKLVNKATKTGGSNYVITDDIDWATGNPSYKQGAYLLGMDTINNNEIPPFNVANVDDYIGNWNSNNPPFDPIFEVQPITDLKCYSNDFVFKGRFKGRVVNNGSASRDFVFTLVIREITPTGGNNIRLSRIIARRQNLVPFNQTWNFDEIYSFSIANVDVGTKYYLHCYTATFITTNGTINITVDNHQETYFQVEAASLCDPSPCKMFMIHETATRVIESITNNELKFKSEYYGRTDSQPYSYTNNGEAGLRSFTNGLQIRRAVLQDTTAPKMFISLKEILEGLNAIDCIGMGIEGNDVRVEPIKYFYNNTIIFEADNVASINKSIITNRIYNQYSFGYDKWETEGSNGLDAIHTKRQYRTQLIHTDVKLEKFSKFITDGYAIETTRRKFGISDDWRYDNNAFLFCLEKKQTIFSLCNMVFYTDFDGIAMANYIDFYYSITPPAGIVIGDTIDIQGTLHNNGIYNIIGVEYFPLLIHLKVQQNIVAEAVTTLAGFFVYKNVVEIGNITTPSNFYDAATVVNYRISPVRNALKWFAWLKQGIKHLQSTAQILFNSGDGNYIAKGQITGGVVYENTAIAENNLIDQSIYNNVTKSAAFIVPEKVVFKYPLGINEFLAISENKYGLVKYRNLNTQQWSYGWISSLKYMPEGGEAEFTLTTAILN